MGMLFSALSLYRDYIFINIGKDITAVWGDKPLTTLDAYSVILASGLKINPEKTFCVRRYYSI
jgi:hypothetical protein